MVDSPVMSPRELASAVVPLSEAADRLADVISKHGFALVLGVANEAVLKRLEGHFQKDLQSLVSEAPPKTCTIERSCAGITQRGETCTISTSSVGRLKRKAITLLQGENYCTFHMSQAPNRAKEIPATFSDAPTSSAVLLHDWTREVLNELGQGGRLCGRGLAHGRFAWECRMLPQVRECFSYLHGSTDLVVGLDMPFFTPASAKASRTNKAWPHVDQNENAGLNRRCYQGVLYVWSSEGADASTTVLLPKSHHDFYRRIMKDSRCPSEGHFVMLERLAGSTELKATFKEGARRIPVPAGALLLWDSRTTHQGWDGGPRLAQPICWEPRAWRSCEALERKRRCCVLGIATSHYASLGQLHRSQCETLFLPRPLVVTLPAHGRLQLRPTLRPMALAAPYTVATAWRHFGDGTHSSGLAEAVATKVSKVL